LAPKIDLSRYVKKQLLDKISTENNLAPRDDAQKMDATKPSFNIDDFVVPEAQSLHRKMQQEMSAAE